LPYRQVDEVTDADPLDHVEGRHRVGQRGAEPDRDQSQLRHQADFEADDGPVTAADAVCQSGRDRQDRPSARRRSSIDFYSAGPISDN
jgi:hypothetical protein